MVDEYLKQRMVESVYSLMWSEIATLPTETYALVLDALNARVQQQRPNMERYYAAFDKLKGQQ